jgi:hypothetical protein
VAERGRFEALTLPGDRRRWEELLAEAGDYDIHHTPGYAAAFAAETDPAVRAAFGGEPTLFAYTRGEHHVLQPYLRRAVGGHWDLASPYGYAGPLCGPPADPADARALIEEYWAEERRYCAAAGIVSAFVRFHPLLENHRLAPAAEPPEARRDVVVVELAAAAERPVIRSRPARYLRAARRDGRFEIAQGEGPDHLSALADLYRVTMVRVGARPEYRFSDEFLGRCASGLGTAAGAVFVAREASSAQAVAALLVLRRGRFLTAFLSGSRPQLAGQVANLMLLVAAEDWGRTMGCDLFNLGGGHRSGDDGIFRFKRQLSGITRPFYTLGRVYLPGVYRDLIAERGAAEPGFFPAYGR